MYFNHEENCPRIPLYVRENLFTIELEIASDHPFLHLQMPKMTKTLVQDAPEILADLKRLLSVFGYPMVFAVVPHDKTAIHKLYARFGFEPLTDWEDNLIYVIHIKDPEDYSDVTLTPAEIHAARQRDARIGISS